MKYLYYFFLFDLINAIFAFIVDLFLLWLLYRFMRPQKIIDDQSTEASVLLFAHDA